MQPPTQMGAPETKTRLPDVLRQAPPVVTAAQRMRAFMQSCPPVAGVNTRALLREGRD